MDKNLNIIDIMKLCMAMIVIAIHTNPEIIIGNDYCREAINSIYKVAVPYFFMASGFLLFRKIQFPLITIEDKSRVRKYIVKIARMYLVWTLLYLPFTIWGFIKDGIPFLKSVFIFIRNVLFVGENYCSWPLWYLLALLVAVLILYLFSSLKLKLWHTLFVAILLYSVGLFLEYCRQHGLMTDVTRLYYSVFNTTRNGFFVGLLYVVLGLLTTYMRPLNKKVLLAGGCVGILIGFAGTIMNYPFAEVLLSYSLFIVTLQIPIQSLSVDMCVNLRYLSTIVYFIHMYWVVLWSVLLPQNEMTHLGVFVLSSSFAVLTGIILLRYKKQSWFKVCFQ